MMITAILNAPPGLTCDIENEKRETRNVPVVLVIAFVEQSLQGQARGGLQPVSIVDGMFYIGGKNLSLEK